MRRTNSPDRVRGGWPTWPPRRTRQGRAHPPLRSATARSATPRTGGLPGLIWAGKANRPRAVTNGRPAPVRREAEHHPGDRGYSNTFSCFKEGSPW